MVSRNKATQHSRIRRRASISSESSASSASSSDTPGAELVIEDKNGLKKRPDNSGSGTDVNPDSDSGLSLDSNSSSGSDSDVAAKRVNDTVSKESRGSVGTKKRKRGNDEGDMDADEDEDENEGAVNIAGEKGKTKPKGGGEGNGKAEGREGEDGEVKVLSHKEQRRLRKKQKTLAAAASSTTQPFSNSTSASKDLTSSPNHRKEKQEQERVTKSTTPKRQNSVWVGNLSYRTTPESLRAFFESAGAKEVTRVHMPTKGVPGLENMKMRMKGVQTVKENRGFAYVDFSTPEAKKLAISLSEKNLDGRRLLIKDGDDFAGRPDSTPIDPSSSSTRQNEFEFDSQPAQSTASPQSNPNPIAKGPTTKTAQKILKAQKQPPCPCLFLGNLGFEATEERIRGMIEGHARALVLGRTRRRKEKEKAKKAKEREGEKGIETDEGGGDENDDVDVEVDVGIKKIRMGTFEDSGLCKGFAFVDFKSTLHSTAVLTNPANHFLDGRALVVEYASADAARRGGYRPEAKAARSKLSKRDAGNGGRKEEEGNEGERRVLKKRSGEDKYNDWKKKQKKGRITNEDSNPDSSEGRNQIQNQHSESHFNPNPNSDDYTKTNMKNAKERQGRQRQRQTPGAALASAQRVEKFAIVPSEGTKLKFS